jgi:hypothetical protein
MIVRLPLARLLGFVAFVALLQGCAGQASTGTNVAPIPEPQEADVAADSGVAAPEPEQKPVASPPRPFRPSAPNEIVSEGVIAERRLVVGDMLRIDLVRAVEQGPLGILRVGVGEKFHAHHTREYHFSQLASAYYTWTADDQPLIIELWENGGKIGEYADQGFRIGPRYAAPRDCPEGATTGLCASLAESGKQVIPPVATAPGQSPDTARRTSPGAEPAAAARPPEPVADARQRSRFHVGLGLGGGAMDFACDGCDFASETGLSGFLSLATSVGPRTLLGVEGTGWTKSESGASAQVYSLTANVTEYLSATSGLFLSAGVGLVGYREDADTGDLSARAVGFSGRLGYEIGAGRVAVVPYVGLVRTFGGADMKRNGQNARLNLAISNVQFGLSIAVQ